MPPATPPNRVPKPAMANANARPADLTPDLEKNFVAGNLFRRALKVILFALIANALNPTFVVRMRLRADWRNIAHRPDIAAS
jgi:hypothetical protein